MIPERILEPFTQDAFRDGLAIGLVAVAVGLVLGWAWRSRRPGPCPVVGLLLAAAAVAALTRVGRTGGGLVVVVVVLGGAGLLVDLYPRVERALAFLAVPGAVVLASETEASQLWVALALGAAVAVGAPLVAMFDLQWRRQPLGPALMVVSLLGVFLTVPETKDALPVLSAALPLALMGWPLNLASLGAGGSFAATGLLAWTVGQGGLRDSAVVGGLTCLGMLVAYPAGRALARQRWLRASGRTRPLWMIVAIAGLHLVAVAWASRVAGLHDDLDTSVGLAILSAAVALVGAMLIEQARMRAGANNGEHRVSSSRSRSESSHSRPRPEHR